MQNLVKQLDDLKNSIIQEHIEDQAWANWFNIQAANSVMEYDESKRKKLKAEFDFMAQARIMRYPYTLSFNFITTNNLSGSVKDQIKLFLEQNK